MTLPLPTAICDVPRYAPRYVAMRVGEVLSTLPVNSYVAHPPHAHPPNCPIKDELTALQLETTHGSRWYGVQRAYINSRLRMVVEGYPYGFEEIMAWPVVPQEDRA